jgi:hypothetical protein
MSRTLRLELTAAPQPLGGCDAVRWRLQIGLGDSEVLGGTTAPLSRLVVVASSPRPSPPKEAREINPSAGGSVKRPWLS